MMAETFADTSNYVNIKSRMCKSDTFNTLLTYQ